MKDGTASQSQPHESEDETVKVSIDLTPGQLDKVIRGTTEAGSISVLLAGLTDIRETLSREPGLLNNPRASKSLLIGLLTLASLPSDGSYIKVVSLAESLNSSPSTTHRYLTSLVSVGLAEQDPKTRQYRRAI